MPKVTLLRNSQLGRMGQVREIDASSTRAAFVLGLAEPYFEPPPKPVEKKPKRTYRRKDIVPEPELVAEEPQPEPEIVPEPEPQVDDTDEDDAPVRLGD